MINNYEYVIGLEIHVKLNSINKLFCKCKNLQEFDNLDPNMNVCPVCTGQPGALPVLNKEPLDKAILLGLALHCKINKESNFDRKSYFYPDLPLGFQITQLNKPTNGEGYVDFFVNNYEDIKKIRIERAHIENDAGKTIHEGDKGILDYNRAGTPLVEIVTFPDFRSDEEVVEFLKELQRIVRFNNIGYADLEKGQMRCDVNISTREQGKQDYGTKVEIKNMNSFSAIKRAISHEFNRQVELLESGKSVSQETRGWDDTVGSSYTMRSKEDALDYRYFPEPDLPLLKLTDEYIEDIRKLLSSSSFERILKYKNEYGFNKEYINGLIQSVNLNNYFEQLVGEGFEPKFVAKWIVGSLIRFLKDDNIDVDSLKFSKKHFIDFLNFINDGKINDSQAKIVLLEMYKYGLSPEVIINQKGFKPIDNSEIQIIIDEVLRENEKAFNDLKNGENKAIGFLVGQIMKKSGGKADPKTVKQLIESKI